MVLSPVVGVYRFACLTAGCTALSCKRQQGRLLAAATLCGVCCNIDPETKLQSLAHYSARAVGSLLVAYEGYRLSGPLQQLHSSCRLFTWWNPSLGVAIALS
jgi:hypothetical protein